MNPALSVVFFSTLSGAGLGLLAWLGVVYLITPLPLSREFALIPFGTGLALLTSGLVASTFHLGQPRRAWRALTQWRSSWLSREGILALAVYPVALALTWQVWHADRGALTQVLSSALFVVALATVVTTAKIYDTLATIRAWHTVHVLPVFLLCAVACGALWNWALLSLAAWQLPFLPALGLSLLLLALGALKLLYWRYLDRGEGDATTGTMTGLGALGRVRPFEAPHSEGNYLLREMGYVLARRHARRLRVLALFGLAFVPALCAALAALVTRGETALAWSAVVAASVGVFVERWLFFAEARHTVVAYYRADRA